MLPLTARTPFNTDAYAQTNQLAGLILIGLRITQDRVIAIIVRGLLPCFTC